MSQDISPQLQALESFRQRARQALAPAREELAAWYRNFFRKKKGPAKATHMVLSLVANAETPLPQWQFSWFPGMHSRSQLFTPSLPLPVIATEDDAVAVGLLVGEASTLRYCAYQDMAAEAWEEADGASLPKQLLISYLPLEPANTPPAWIVRLQDQIRQQAEGIRGRSHWGLGPPEPFGLPTVSPGIIEAVRNGDAQALAAWADAVEQAGATDAANTLRWLPQFHALIADEVRAVSPQFGFAVTMNPKGYAWWWIGDACSEADNSDARQLGKLLSAWNETHPALEWLLRSLAFPHVEVDAIRFATDENAGTKRADLAAGEHLGPVEDDVRVLKVDVPGWKPIEGEPEGD